MISGERLMINLGNPAKLIKVLLAKKSRVLCMPMRYPDVTWDFVFLLVCCLEMHLGTHACILEDSHLCLVMSFQEMNVYIASSMPSTSY